MKNAVAFLFLFIFSFQVLPVKELGKVLFKGQLTEEIKETGSSSDDSNTFKLKKNDDPLHFANVSFRANLDLATKILVALHETEKLQHFVAEVPTPPPLFI
jgi:hypothetical protein